MMKRIFWLAITAIMCLGLFSGCSGNKLPHNAVMYGEIYTNRTWLQDEFYESNLTSGSWSDVEEEYVSGDAYPKNRTIIITDSVEYNKVFKEFPVEVDFEKTMLLMHCFTTASGNAYAIKSISVDEQTLIVNYNQPSIKRSPPNASMPLAKWVIVVMDKLDIETAEFIYGK